MGNRIRLYNICIFGFTDTITLYLQMSMKFGILAMGEDFVSSLSLKTVLIFKFFVIQ